MLERLRQAWRVLAGPGAAAASPAPLGRVAEVGWLLDTDKARFIWAAPRRVQRDDPPPTHAKSAALCPAVIEHEARMWEVPCPIDLRLGFRRDDQGRPVLVNLDGDRSAIRTRHLNQLLSLVAEREWRHPARPMIQIWTPYVFVADEPVWAVQLPPVSHYQAEGWPGLLFGGRLPIHIWPRPLMWAFEWFDPARPLVLKRGEPWFNLRFETHDPTRPIRLVEAERTAELEEQIKGLAAVSNYVRGTHALFKVAEARRPARLLVPKARPPA